MLTYEDMRYFRAVAEHCNLRRAAQAIGVSQPSLSYMIKKLEFHMDVPLLRRHAKGVELTASGRVLAERIDSFLIQWEDLDTEITKESQRLFWRMSIGCHPSVASYALPSILPGILKSYPKLQIKLVHGLSREINQLVIDGQIDLGLVINPFAQAELVVRPLMQDTVSLWQSRLPIKNLDVLIYDPSLAQTQWLLRRLEHNGYAFARHIESENLAVIARLVESGSGVGILPGRTIDQSKAELFDVNLSYQDRLCAVFRHEFRKKPYGREFLECVKSELA